MSFYFFEFSFWIDDFSSRDRDGYGNVGDLGGGIGGKGGIGCIGSICSIGNKGNIGNCIPRGGGGRTEASKGTKLKAKFISEKKINCKNLNRENLPVDGGGKLNNSGRLTKAKWDWMLMARFFLPIL